MAKASAAKTQDQGNIEQKAGPSPTKPQRSGETVTIACRLPMGMTMFLHEEVEVPVQVQGGGVRYVKQFQRMPPEKAEPVTVFGTRVPYGQQARCLIVGGFAMTPGVDRDFAAEWFRQNRNLEAVKNGEIFMQDDDKAAKDAIKSGDVVKHKFGGMEPIDVALVTDSDGNKRIRDKRIVRPNNADVGSLHTADEQKARFARGDD